MASRRRYDRTYFVRIGAYVVCTVIVVSIILVFVIKPYDIFRYYSGIFTHNDSSDQTDEMTVVQDSYELRQRFIMRFYMYGVKRQPTDAELEAWISRLEQGMSGSDVARAFLLDSDILSSNVSNEDYIERLYRCLLGREPDEDGFEYWVETLENGVTRDSVFESMLRAKEWTSYCSSYGVTP